MKTLLEIQESSGIVPKALENRPILDPSLHIYVTAFYDLSFARPYVGMGSPSPIPLSEIVAYCDYYGFTDVEFRRSFLKYIRAMDNAQLVVMNKQADKESKSAK